METSTSPFTFIKIESFRYVDQLGMSSRYDTKVYCRQTLIGGNYGLLSKGTFDPDYYSVLLWHRLMGKGVLSIGSDASSYLRTYAHCSKGRAGNSPLTISPLSIVFIVFPNFDAPAYVIH